MKPLLTALLLLSFSICFSQKNPDSLFFVNMKSRKIDLPKKHQDLIYNLPFHSVQVLDARPDTNSIGFVKYSATNRLFFEKGLVNTFTDFINTNYKLSEGTNNLLILIKEFRISNYVAKGDINNLNIINWSSGIIINAELFLNNENNYHALYKIDSILVALSANETISESVVRSFRSILYKSEDKNLSEMHIGKTAFAFDDIKKHVEDFTNFPILKSAIFNKGAYKNFNEFRTNNPSIKNFEVKKGKLSDELFITEGNQSYPLQNFWGYCDGKNLFIRSTDNLFKLIKAGNTFNLKGIKSLSGTYNRTVGNEVLSSYLIGVPMSAFVKNNYKTDPTAFQLNMQTGQLY